MIKYTDYLFIVLLTLFICSCSDNEDEQILDADFVEQSKEKLEDLTIIHEGEPLTFKGIDDHYYIAGDMLLTRDQIAEFYESDYGKKGAFKAARKTSLNKWPNCHVSYKFSTSNPISRFAKSAVLQAMSEIESNTGIDFRYASRMAPRSSYLLIENTSSQSRASVGFQNSPRLLLTNIPGLGTARHELGHVVGLEHEHQRNDSRDFLSFDLTNLSGGTGQHVAISNNVGLGPFDFNSVMMYHSCAGNNGIAPNSGCTTADAVFVRRDNNGLIIRNANSTFSSADFAGMNTLYSCSGGTGGGSGNNE